MFFTRKAAQTEQFPDTIACHKCDTVIKTELIVCKHCGADMRNNPASSHHNGSQKKSAVSTPFPAPVPPMPYIDYQTIVDEYWRGFLVAAARGDQALGISCIAALENRIQQVASILAPQQRVECLAQFEKAREHIAQEYALDPNGLKRRLEIPYILADATPQKIGVCHDQYHNRQSLGEVAAKTVVRAGIWALFWELVK